MTVTWKDIETTLTERFGATRRWRRGNARGWNVPMNAAGSRPGYLTVEVTLRPRWCSLTIDRWHTTDRDPDVASPWLERHVWPAVDAALETSRYRVGIFPAGPTYANASPVDRAGLLDVLVPWVEAERGWGQHGGGDQ